MLTASLLEGSLLGALPSPFLSSLGVSYEALRAGEVFRLITGTFLSQDAGMFLRQFIFAGLVTGYTESVRGTKCAAALFFGLDICGTLGLMAVIGWGASVVDRAAVRDVGMSIDGFGLIGVIVSRGVAGGSCSSRSSLRSSWNFTLHPMPWLMWVTRWHWYRDSLWHWPCQATAGAGRT